jgi:hypothetical protein
VTRISTALSYLLICGAGLLAQVTIGGWSQSSPLTCPLCPLRFSWRDYSRGGKACPKCRVPLGMPFYYRAILVGTGVFVMGWTMYVGYKEAGPGWLIVGLPFAGAFGIFAEWIILFIFPPMLSAYAEGSTWLKL